MSTSVALGNVGEQIDAANDTGHAPVVFIHGLWLLESSWDRWAELFENAGYAPVAPGWPDDPETVDEANANPDVFAHKTIGQVADHFADTIGKLNKKPAVIGRPPPLLRKRGPGPAAGPPSRSLRLSDRVRLGSLRLRAHPDRPARR